MALLVTSNALPVQAQETQAKPLRVVELFTSHGCSSCPPADRLLGQLIQDDPDLIALEFHVDYWNQLVHGGSNWVDPFSSPEWTARQQSYNLADLGGRRGVYTPQIIVNGRNAVVGSDVRGVNRALALDEPVIASIAVQENGADLEIAVETIGKPAIGASVYLVRFAMHAVTDITAGENRHLMLTNHHIVRSMENLGAISDASSKTFRVPAALRGDGCAVIVQTENPGSIFAAANCP